MTSSANIRWSDCRRLDLCQKHGCTEEPALTSLARVCPMRKKCFRRRRNWA